MLTKTAEATAHRANYRGGGWFESTAAQTDSTAPLPHNP